MHVCRNCGHPVDLTGDEVAAIQAAYLSGAKITELAREHRVSRGTIYRALLPVRHPDEVGQQRLFTTDPVAPED